MDETKISGASYILNFYAEIEKLNKTLATYYNICIETETKYKTQKSIQNAKPDDIQHYLRTNQILRQEIIETWIKYTSLKEVLNIEEDKEIEQVYKNCTEKPIIKRKDASEYTKKINSVLVKGVMPNLLSTSQKIISDIYE